MPWHRQLFSVRLSAHPGPLHNMSSTTSIQEMAQLVDSLVTQDRLEIGTIALLAYEYIITFDQEVALFWKRKMTGATVLFLATRYLALLSYLFLGTATFAPMSDQIQNPVIISQYIVWAAFSALRALALSRMNWLVAGTVFLLASGPFAVNIWVTSLGLIGENVPVVGCSGGSNQTRHQAIIGTRSSSLSPALSLSSCPSLGVSVAHACGIVAESLVIVITVWHTVKATGGLRGSRSGRPSLADILLVNGTVYFLLIFTLNALHLVLTLFSISFALDPISEVDIFTDPLTAILICRFLIALQSANQSMDEVGESDYMGSMQFSSRIMGSLGEPIGARPSSSLIAGSDGNAMPVEARQGITDTPA
ncbi:hypothetical protein OH77DRAFT_944914 [Trametes cingulata]|nr:hypothetical protein OH77DRAFT_944914 [Trametes cingulata]